jgi:hypothetical protein
MAGQPTFRHYHCSSRFDRSADALETDLDAWMADSSLITLTEVDQNSKRAAMAEKGWRFHNARDSAGPGADEAAILWKVAVWHRKQVAVRRLISVRQQSKLAHKPQRPIWAASAVLKHAVSDQTLLVSVSHLPAHIQGNYPAGHDAWAARKVAYTTAMSTWSEHVLALQRRHHPDAVLVCADWNLNLKEDWVREYLHHHWARCGLRPAWTDFPTSGGSIGGNRIIDGSYYDGMKVAAEPDLGYRVRSSDHRPYRESFTLVGGANPKNPGRYDPATGHTSPGKEWWGFGDYAYDEMYEKVQVADDGSTVVTFDFDQPPY